MTVDLIAWTHPGSVREHNEDAIALPGVVLAGVPRSPVWLRYTSPPVGAVFGVFDGLGGHRGGAHAARSSAMTVATLDRLPDGAPPQIGPLLSALSDDLHAEMDRRPDLRGLGSTAVIGAVLDGGLQIANVGDSRCYLHVSGYSTMMTTDDRTRGGNTLSQSLGGTVRPTAVSPHVVEVDLEPGARVLMCSDGLSDVVPFAAIQRALASLDPHPLVTDLVRQALDAGAPDNVSVLLYADDAAEGRHE